MHKRHSSVLTLGLLLAACGGSKAPAQDASKVSCPPGQTFDGTYCQVDQSVATREEPLAVPAEPSAEEEDASAQEGEEEATPEEPAPEAPQAEPAVVRTSAAPVDVTMAAQAAPLIHYLSSSHLPQGARPLGAPFAGQFAEGQILERKVSMTAGKCYTVVAAGLPPIAEVNLELSPPGSEKAEFLDSTKGPQAVLGSRDTCIRPAASGAYTLVLFVESGRGIAAAQVFEK